jgi:hypothetical protein
MGILQTENLAMKSIIASVFAVALLSATAASAQVHVGVHVGGVHVGVGAHPVYHHPVYRRPVYHRVARHCWWHNHHHYCR